MNCNEIIMMIIIIVNVKFAVLQVLIRERENKCDDVLLSVPNSLSFKIYLLKSHNPGYNVLNFKIFFLFLGKYYKLKYFYIILDVNFPRIKNI